MISYKIATKEDIDVLMSSRLEMLKVVNDLPEDHVFDDVLINESRRYFLEGNQTTVLAFVDGTFAGCASVSYIEMMPTFSHPTGKRAHVMNVYTRNEYRRQGIAVKMMNMLIEDAWSRGATEISLDATSLGRPLYEKLGFVDSEECMVLVK